MTQSSPNPDNAAGDTLAKVARDFGGKFGEDWYLDQANRGQLLLNHGHTEQARQVFQATLAGLGEEPSYARAVIMERMGRCVLMGGRPLIAAALFQQSMDITQNIPLTDGVIGLQGTVQSGLGDAFVAASRLGEARKSYEAALMAAEHAQDLRAQAVEHDHLGALALRQGRLDEALVHHQGARQTFQELDERGPEAIAWHHLGDVFAATEKWEEAEKHYSEAARLSEACGDLATVAQSQSQLAAVNEKTGRTEAADVCYRKAVETSCQTRNPILIRRHLSNLARFLQSRPDGLAGARHFCEEALATVTLKSLAPDVWTTYGILADVIDKEAARTTDGTTRAAQEAQVRNYRHIQQFGPQLQAAVAGLGEDPSLARAVIMERFGRCFLMGGKPALAVTFFQESIGITENLAPSNGVKGLQGVAQSGLGDAYYETEQLGEARKAHEAALKIAEELQDLRAQALEQDHLGGIAIREGRPVDAMADHQVALGLSKELQDPALEAGVLHHLGMVFEATEQWDEAEKHYSQAARIREECGDLALAAQSRSRLTAVSEKAGLATIEAPGVEPAPTDVPQAPTLTKPAVAGAACELTLYEDVRTDCVVGTDLLIEIRHASRILPWTKTPELLPEDNCPMLAPRARTYLDEDGALRFCIPPGEPVFEQHPQCTLMQKISREVAVSGRLDVVWHLMRGMNGEHTVKDILAGVPSDERPDVAHLLAALADLGAIDVSGRTLGRFLHTATKKGVLQAGGLESDDVLRLATDGDYRAYSDVPHIAVSEAVPDCLRDFHILTRSRRSRRNYVGQALRREDFDALLQTACGVTGAMQWGARELKLRAYPSSGALYAVEIYPVAFRVDGLEPGVYHYVAGENTLDVVRPGNDQDCFVAASLPMEREMVSGAAALICLVGEFKRHERKYGEGGYRMMVAEAGHISQNLVLAATALGLAARPFGGVFDGLINKELGLDEAEEQFLLSVLVGHAVDDDQAKAELIEPNG